MAKLKSPLFSLEAHGSLEKVISFVKRKVGTIAIKRPQPPEARTLAQLSWRTMYQKCSALWQVLSEAEKANWESLARPLHMTGFAYWQSQCLKPNPGIYLPLAGGTMTGPINMSSQQVGSLPAPAADNDAARKKYVDDQIDAHLYTQGCRLWRSADLSFYKESSTLVEFDVELYDTDNMHSNTVSPYRVTCRTAGKYAVSVQLQFTSNLDGTRQAWVTSSAKGTIMLQKVAYPFSGGTTLQLLTTIDLEVDEFIWLSVYQDSTGWLSLLKLNYYSPIFCAQRIG